MVRYSSWVSSQLRVIHGTATICSGPPVRVSTTYVPSPLPTVTPGTPRMGKISTAVARPAA